MIWAKTGTRRRLGFVAALPILLAVFLVVGAAAATAEESEPNRFEAIDLAAQDGPLNADFRPAALAGGGEMTVILEVSGASVGEHLADARDEGRTLSEAQREGIRDRLEARQRAIEVKIRALGGRILTDYQDAYNGIAASVPLGKLAAVAAIPAVTGLHPARIFERDNTAGAQYIGAPTVWQDTGRTGKGVKIGIIDSGIDYTHANFGGPGTGAAYKANISTFLEPGSFPTAKVAGGYDFVGDDYTARPSDEREVGVRDVTAPLPDPDPIDCEGNGHGSHVAGSAAGAGVLSDGTTYRGPYNAGIYAANNFLIGPGTAPEARLYAYRVFGCSGSTSEEILLRALDRALADGMDVVNMSLGSPLDRVSYPSRVATNTLAAAGVVVVASAGNSGASAYITGGPASANRAISVAALDASRATFPGASLTLSTGQTVSAQVSNGAPLVQGSALAVKVLRKADGTVSLGCDPKDYTDVAGKLVVVLRGTCARVARAVYGQKAGAAAVAMINTSAAYPFYEGEITTNPDTGERYTVTIPFLGIRGVLGPSPFDDGDLLVAADGGNATMTEATVSNVNYQRLSTFTSGGPRNVDSSSKPDVAAPGQSVLSTDVGTGFKAAAESGTSMAAPMTAGVAALVTEAHPIWSTEQIKAAIMNTADASTAKIQAYDPRRAGSGVVDARKAVDTVGLALAGEGQSALSYGYEPLGGAYSETLRITLENTGPSPISYSLSSSIVGSPLGAVVTISPSSVTVPASGRVTVDATMSMSAAAVAALPAATGSNFGTLRHIVRGAIVATPSATGPGLYPLRVPFMLVPRGLSNVRPGALTAYTTTANEALTTLPVANTGVHSGAADVFAWGISDELDVGSGRLRETRRTRGDEPESEGAADIRAAGVQILPREALCGTNPVGACGKAGDRSVIFAVNMHGMWSNPSYLAEVDVAIDLQNDGEPEFFVVGADLGLATTGSSDGRFASLVYDAAGKLVDTWVAEAPMNGSTMLLPALASQIGLSLDEGSTTFRYTVTAFSREDDFDATETGIFRLSRPPVSTGQFETLAPGETKTIGLSVDRSTLPGSEVYGWMVVSHDDPNGAPQADLVPLGSVPGS